MYFIASQTTGDFVLSTRCLELGIAYYNHYVMKPLHLRFVHEYLVDRNGAAAAIRAGYSRRTARQIAYELLTRPDVAAAVRAGEAEIAADAKVTRAAVLTGLQEAIDIARARSDPSAMIAAWREIAKMCGFYAPERAHVHFSANGWALRNEVAQMTDSELAALIVSAERPGQGCRTSADQ